MTNTPFSKQVEIVADFYMECAMDYPELVATYDLGLPLAVAVTNGGVDIDSLTPKGREWITDTFIGIANELEVDYHGDYDSLDDMFGLMDE